MNENTWETKYGKLVAERMAKTLQLTKKTELFEDSVPCIDNNLNELQGYLKIIFNLLKKERDRDYDAKVIKEMDEKKAWEHFFDHYYNHPMDPVIEYVKISSIISIMAMIEDILYQLYNFLDSNFPQPIKINDFKGGGSIIQKLKRYLKQYGKFSIQMNKQWDIVIDLYKIRNLIAHGGKIKLDDENMPEDKKVHDIIKKYPTVFWNETGKITIEEGFYSFTFETLDMFFALLNTELDRLFKMGNLSSKMSPYP